MSEMHSSAVIGALWCELNTLTPAFSSTGRSFSLTPAYGIRKHYGELENCLDTLQRQEAFHNYVYLVVRVWEELACICHLSLHCSVLLFL